MNRRSCRRSRDELRLRACAGVFMSRKKIGRKVGAVQQDASKRMHGQKGRRKGKKDRNENLVAEIELSNF